MELVDGSAAHLLSGGSYSSRTSSTLSTYKKHRRTAAQALRRPIFFTEEDSVKGQKIRRVSRHHTSSTSPIESTRIRPTKSRKPLTGVAGHEPTPLTDITSAGATWKKSKSKPINPTSTTVSGLRDTENSTKGPHKSGDAKTVKSPLSKSTSAILNVGLSDVATGNATHNSTYLSINTLDELSRWDMDSLPSIPSPPDSPEPNTISNPTRPSSLANPFSTPIDDDAPLADEIPFPLNRQTKIVLEDMGIKKSKNVARARGIGGSILSRHLPFPGVEPPDGQNQAQSTLPGLPHPLPLRQNTKTPPPFSNATPPQVFTQTEPTPAPKVSSGPSSSWKDAWGCMHLGAADCELSIAFPETSHFEMWDMSDSSHIACPALLCLMAKDAYPWSGMPLALPDVTHIDIRCEDLPLPSRMSIYDPSQEYGTRYVGSKIGTAKDDLNALVDTEPPAIGFGDITIEGKWVRTYSRPGVEGSGLSRVVRRGDVASAYASASNPIGPRAHARGWHLKFWIPIPTRLFVKRETRVFNIDARIWMMGDEERALSLDENTDGRVYPLIAHSQMSVSHLRTAREMDAWLW
ncbi:hypothetical protein BDZ97DRAFT_1913807 [Flammula alnicola]|nr:hypothetical protein BDZ97DRAFT_1913807 [Flammula alnicola]